MPPNFDDLLLGASCAVRTPDNSVVGTAWLLDNMGHLLTAGHLLGTKTPIEEVIVTFLDDPTQYRARRIAWQYNFNCGVDFAVLELLGPLPARAPLPISLARRASGTLKLFGYGKTLVDLSPAVGSFVGPFHPQNVTANRLFSLESSQSREEGYSGAAIFSTDAQAVVGIQIEGTVLRADAAHGTTVLAMPLFRIAEFVDTLPIFADAIAARDDDYYLYHVYLSYERDGLVERWLNLFLLDELTGWLQQELPGKPEVFFDHNPMRRVWDSKVVDAIRRSCCLVAISSPTYWESPECLAELESLGLPRFGGQSLVCILGFILSYSSPPVVLSVSSPQVSLTRMRQKDDAASARSDFQTPAATDSQRQNVFAGYYTTRPSMRRSLYELPRAS